MKCMDCNREIEECICFEIQRRMIERFAKMEAVPKFAFWRRVWSLAKFCKFFWHAYLGCALGTAFSGIMIATGAMVPYYHWSINVFGPCVVITLLFLLLLIIAAALGAQHPKAHA